MRTEAKRAIMENAADLLDVPPPTAAAWEAVAVVASGVGLAQAAFDPTPHPAPPPQDWPHAAIVRRSIAGDDDVAESLRRPSLRGLYLGRAKSEADGAPIRSSSSEDRFGKGALRGGGGRAHDPNTERDRYSRLSVYEARAEVAVEKTRSGRERLKRGITGATCRAWALLLSVGAPARRNIHAGGGPDAIEREQRREAKRAKAKRRKRGGEVMQPPPPRKPHWINESRPQTPCEIADAWNAAVALPEGYPMVHARGVRAAIDDYEDELRALLPAGYIAPLTAAQMQAKAEKRAQTKRERETTKGEAGMATLNGYDLQGWKEILAIVGCSANTARALMARGERRLPVVIYLGTPQARTSELRAWQDAEIAAALCYSSEGRDA